MTIKVLPLSYINGYDLWYKWAFDIIPYSKLLSNQTGGITVFLLLPVSRLRLVVNFLLCSGKKHSWRILWGGLAIHSMPLFKHPWLFFLVDLNTIYNRSLVNILVHRDLRRLVLAAQEAELHDVVIQSNVRSVLTQIASGNSNPTLALM